MYVCICNAIKESDLRRAASSNSGDAEEVYAAMGCQVNCGQCLMDAEAILFEERELAIQPAFAA